MSSKSAIYCALVIGCFGAAPASAELLTHKDLSASIAVTIAQTAIEVCKTNGYAVSATVVGRNGEILVQIRGDNTGPHTFENSFRKAYTARTFRSPSGALADRLKADPTLGLILRDLRRHRGWTLKEMSERSGIPVSTLSKVEHDRLTLTYDKLLQLSQKLNIRISELFAESEQAEEGVTARRSIGRPEQGGVGQPAVAHQAGQILLAAFVDRGLDRLHLVDVAGFLPVVAVVRQ